jgi:hypothetical protein
MKHPHRRTILRYLSSLLALPALLRIQNLQGALRHAGRRLGVKDNSSPAMGNATIRPKISVPQGSVMRRG